MAAAAPAESTRIVNSKTSYTKAECYLELVLVDGRQNSFRHDKLRRRCPQRFLRQEQSLGMDHLLIVFPLLNRVFLESSALHVLHSILLS